jgi:3-hydroxyacyl-CoA dehydrogenase
VSYVTYGVVTAQAVSPQITDADIAMSTGFNWIGPVALMQALGGYDEVVKMAQEVDLDKNLVKQLQGVEKKNRKPSGLPFDYRKFFRAKL